MRGFQFKKDTLKISFNLFHNPLYHLLVHHSFCPGTGVFTLEAWDSYLTRKSVLLAIFIASSDVIRLQDQSFKISDLILNYLLIMTKLLLFIWFPLANWWCMKINCKQSNWMHIFQAIWKNYLKALSVQWKYQTLYFV